MKNKEFWKGAVAGALVVTCIGTGAFAGTGLAAKGTALGDRKCTSKLAYLEELIDRYYLGTKRCTSSYDILLFRGYYHPFQDL